MPRLTERTREANRTRIESAALELFLSSGYHGVTMREIALASEVSLGNLYVYFPDKLALFAAVLESERRKFLDPSNPVIRYLMHCDFPDDMHRFADAIQESVRIHAKYFKLIYLDVVEFDGRHVRELFSQLQAKFEGALSEQLNRKSRSLGIPSSKISFSLVSVYLSFYQYFLLRHLFGAERIYDHSNDSQVVEGLVSLFRNGLSSPAGARA